ncbi:hypothetical protein Nepgr_022620 [Nepenthes gracilis]|uniref:Mannosyl-oligosaccharide glucosidase n=1 Tax=Nepenthes gracilis TaxID=150966 RepID=A0AAD3SZ66_NEPGR|nr:hypothetical protein Nepgr_022620 [Nepenthes gracilis]
MPIQNFATMTGSARRNARSRTKSSAEVPGEDRSVNNPKLSLKARKGRSRARSFTGIISLIGFGICSFSILLYIIFSNMAKPLDEDQKRRVVTPFPAPKLMDLPQFQGVHKESLYWGTYRPHVYLGIRARSPRSLIAGLMWIGIKDGRFFMRHVCQDSDELNTYGWTHHNGRDYGRQLLVDRHLTLETSFFKSKLQGSGYGGDWAVRVDVRSDQLSSNEGIWERAHFFFYVGNEGGETISLSRAVLDIRQSSLLAFGSRIDVGNWQLHLDSMDNLEVHYAGFKTPHFHNLSDLVQANLADQVRRFGDLQLSDTLGDSPNILVFQISANAPFKADIAFVSGTDSKSPRVEERISSLTGKSLSDQLIQKKNEFDHKFERCFNLTNKGI